MILILCAACKCALRVIGGINEVYSLVGPESSFWPNKFICFRCGGPAQGVIEAQITFRTTYEIKEVSPTEAFAAIHGLGLPEERLVDPLIVDSLMREQPVRKVVSTNVRGGSKVMVDFIELWDGTRFYFGSSSDGAVIYKITRPHSYVSKVSP